MSRAITWKDFTNSLKRTAKRARAIEGMEFPKDQGMLPIVNMDSYLVEGLQNDLRDYDKSPALSDYPIGVPSLELVSGVEPVVASAFDGPSAVEGIMPLEFPTTAPKVSTKAPHKSVPVALPHKALPELPSPAQSTAQQESTEASLEESRLENLLFVLEGSGRKVKEVKPLSSGTIKITLDDLLKTGQSREPELVRVRR